MGRGATNKRKGSNAERYYMGKFKELGFDFCRTSREASKLHDNAKIDLVFIPYNIQIKAGKQASMNPGKELYALSTEIKKLFPPGHEVHDKSLVLIHYEEVGRGNKRLPIHEKVYMSLEQYEYFKEKNSDLEYLNLKEIRKSSRSLIPFEFRTIVIMTFEYFVEQIVNKKII